MGKRSDFARVERDFYPTPPEAIRPLLRHLPPGSRFCEPCAGDGALADYLIREGMVCASMWDTAPQRADIDTQDARTRLCGNIDFFITNPPWTRSILHSLIVALSNQSPTWLLFDADWMHTRQAWEFLPRLRTVQAVGRVKWIAGSEHYGKDNCAWHLFDALRGDAGSASITFHGVDPRTPDVSHIRLDDLLL